MSRKAAFLRVLDREHETTMRVLRAFPGEQLEFRPHPRSNSARELGFVFTMECGLGMKVWNDEFRNGIPEGSTTPSAPDTWPAILSTYEATHAQYRSVIETASEEDLDVRVNFFVAPQTMGEITRHDLIWFLLHDQIHHRGQFSVYLRMVGAKVPSIYGPTADEPWV